jgi:hypothetical protein
MTLEVVIIVVKGDKLDLCTVLWKLSNLSSPWQLPSGATSKWVSHHYIKFRCSHHGDLVQNDERCSLEALSGWTEEGLSAVCCA